MKNSINNLLNNKKYQNIFICLFIIFLAFCFSYNSSLFITKNSESLIDSSVFRTIALQMNKGLMPYKDSFDHKGPILYFVNYIGTLISFDHGIWFVEFIFILFTFIYVYKISRLFNNRIQSLLVLVFAIDYLFEYFLHGNFVEEYAMMFITVSLYIFIDYFKNERINKFRLIICGTFFACTFLLRQNMISLWIVFCLAVLIKNIINKSIQNVGEFLVWFICGVLIVFIPTFVWLWFNNAFDSFLFDYFTFNFMYSSDSTRATLANKIDSFKHFFLTFPMLVTIVSSSIDMKKNRIINISIIAFALLTSYLTCVSGQKYEHYGMVFIPIFAYGYSLLFQKLSCSEIKKEYKYLLLGFFLGINIFYNWYTLGIDMANNTISYLLNDSIEEEIEGDEVVYKIVEENTNEKDTISVFGNNCIFYLKTKRLPASKFSYQFPIAEINDEFFDIYFNDLTINKPKFIVISQYGINDGMQKFIEDNNYYICYESNDKKTILYTNIKGMVSE